MKPRDYITLACASLAVPAVFASVAIADSIFELGLLHSTWQSGALLFGFVAIGLYLLWRVQFRSRWQQIVLMAGYGPAMFMLLTWLGLVIQFNLDGCMAQQTIAADRPKMDAG